MKVLVTGGTGFIGSFLVERLVGRGDQVRCMVLEGDELGPLSQWPVEICYGDVCQPETLTRVVRDVAYIYHLAGVKNTWDEATYFRVNYEGTKNLLESCLKENPRIKRLIFASSQAAAGPSKDGHELSEEEVCSPLTAYGRSKQAAEEYLQARWHVLPITILRLALVYGPRNITTERVLRMVKRRTIPYIGQFFYMIYIQDAVDAMILAAEHERACGQMYFIRGKECVTLHEVFELSSKILNRRGWMVPIPLGILKFAARLAWIHGKLTDRPSQPLNMKNELSDLLQKYWVCSGEKARRELGFEPKVPLEEGIRKTIRWYEQFHPDQKMK